MANEQSNTSIMKSPPEAIKKATEQISLVLAECNTTALAKMPALTQAVTLAMGIQNLRAALTKDVVEQVFMPLQSSPLGFVTDKDKPGKDDDPKTFKPGYPWETVRDCMIEGMVHGLRPVNNEVNIIAGRCYGAKNGVERLVKDFHGISNVVVTPGCAQLSQDGKTARVPIRLDAMINGKPISVVRELKKEGENARDTRIEVRVNANMGPDAIIGKATRKIYKAALDQLSGGILTVPDGDAIDTTGEVVSGVSPEPTPPEQDGRRVKLGANGAKASELKVQEAAAAVPDLETA